MDTLHLTVIDETLWLVLPPSIVERAQEFFGEDLSAQASAAMKRANGQEKERLFGITKEIEAHFSANLPGWGEWPDSLNDCLAIGSILGILLARDVEELLLEMPEEALAELDEECRSRGIALEQLLIERMIEDRGED